MKAVRKPGHPTYWTRESRIHTILIWLCLAFLVGVVLWK